LFIYFETFYLELNENTSKAEYNPKSSRPYFKINEAYDYNLLGQFGYYDQNNGCDDLYDYLEQLNNTIFF
jgi:hypothetical protein